MPDWARAALPELPETMERSNRRAQQYEAGIISAVEAAVLAAQRRARRSTRSWSRWTRSDGGGVVQLTRAGRHRALRGDLPLGERVRVRLTLADVAKRQVRFELV